MSLKGDNDTGAVSVGKPKNRLSSCQGNELSLPGEQGEGCWCSWEQEAEGEQQEGVLFLPQPCNYTGSLLGKANRDDGKAESGFQPRHH